MGEALCCIILSGSMSVLLQPLTKSRRLMRPYVHRMVQQLIQRTEQAIQPQLQCLLTSIIDGTAVDSDLKDEYHMLIYQVCIIP